MVNVQLDTNTYQGAHQTYMILSVDELILILIDIRVLLRHYFGSLLLHMVATDVLPNYTQPAESLLASLSPLRNMKGT